jgi:N,N-dimethylformamidase
MDIQAYFEEWSRRPGETVRMAISTPHPSVRATLVRLVSGPGQGETPEGRTVDFSSALDATVPGRVQGTAIGSYAQLPLPAAIAGGAVSVHCWAWPTVPAREAPQTIWSLGETALVIANGAIHLRSLGETILSIEQALVARNWYSIIATIADGQARIDLQRIGGKVGAHRVATAKTSAQVSATTLTLAASGLDSIGSPLEPYNGKIDSPALYLTGLAGKTVAALHAGKHPDAKAWASWALDRDFAAEAIAPTFRGGRPGQLVNGAERGVTGRNWDGRSDSFLEVPGQYSHQRPLRSTGSSRPKPINSGNLPSPTTRAPSMRGD